MDIRSPGNDPIPGWFKAYESKFGKDPADPAPSVIQDWHDMWNALQALANVTGDGNPNDAAVYYSAFENAYTKMIEDLNASGFTPDKPGYQDVMDALMNLNNNYVNVLNYGARKGGWTQAQALDYLKTSIQPGLVNVLSLIQHYAPPGGQSIEVRNLGGDPVADWAQLERDVEKMANDAGTQALNQDLAQVYVDWFTLDGDLPPGKLTPEYKALEQRFVTAMVNLFDICRDPTSSKDAIANALGSVKEVLVEMLTYIQKP